MLAGNLGDLSLAQEAVEKTLEVFGSLEGLILNHGMMDPVTKIETSDVEKWKDLFDVNFFSAVAFVSTEKPKTIVFLTDTGQSSYSIIAREQWLRSFHFFRCIDRSILDMGRIRRFEGRN